jgi:excisionase family DNA binding protein
MKLIDANKLSMDVYNGMVSYQTIMALARKGQLPSVKVGKRTLFDKQVIEDYMTKQMQQSTK